ncbi:MAG: hypothetical protein ACR2JG_04915 [Geodermatophilaceae bacterium]
MKMPSEWLGEAAQRRMIDGHAQVMAPVALWAAMSTLAGTREPNCTLVQANLSTGATEWRALWLVEETIVYASMIKSVERWTAYSEAEPSDVQPDDTIAWTRRVKDILRVELQDVDCKRVRSLGESEGEWRWSVGAVLQFADAQVQLPLFGVSESEEADRTVKEFLDALVARI